MIMASAQHSMSKGSVARATITSDVQNREPVDSISTVTADDSKVLYFTEIQDMAGHIFTHRWEYNGQAMAAVDVEIGGPTLACLFKQGHDALLHGRVESIGYR